MSTAAAAAYPLPLHCHIFEALTAIVLISLAVAVMGEVCSGASVAAAGVANDKQIPMISPASTSASLSQKDYFFRTVSCHQARLFNNTRW